MTAYRVALFAGAESLGPEWDALFRHGPGPQSSRAWYAASAAAALPAGAAAVMVGVSGPEGPAGLVPMVSGPGGRWASLTTPYTCLFQPLIEPGRAREVAAAFGGACRPVAILEALDPDWAGLPAFRAGLGDAGLRTRSFEHFGNWHGPVPGGSWEAYLQARPGTLRETIRRKTRLVERDPAMRLEFLRDPAALGPALAAYEAVYARSWKEKEPYPDFNRTLVEALGPGGALRIGVLWAGATPIAAQYWTVCAGTATVLKLAHDDAYRRFSPGTVLTAFAIRCLIERDRVGELDFGRGDDPYKQAWAGERRVRMGLLIAHPWSRRGAAALARHDGGRVVRYLQTVMRRTTRFNFK